MFANIWRRQSPELSIPCLSLVLIALNLSAPAFCGEIHDAAGIGDVQRVEALLKENPNLAFVKDSRGFTPLHVAAERGQVKVAELLLANKYVTGSTNSTDFAPPGNFATKMLRNDWDVLVAKLDPTGAILLFSKRFGGRFVY